MADSDVTVSLKTLLVRRHSICLAELSPNSEYMMERASAMRCPSPDSRRDWFRLVVDASQIDGADLHSDAFPRVRALLKRGPGHLSALEEAFLGYVLLRSIVDKRDVPFVGAAGPSVRNWLELLDHGQRKSTQRIDIGVERDLRVDAVLRLIANRYRDSRFSLGTAANEVHLSPSRLAHLVLQETGSSFSDLVRDTRIRAARRFLLSTQLSVKEIAFAVGFANPSQFGREFRTSVGVPPKRFRHQHRPGSSANSE